jgi:cold shock CspA family protein
MTGRIFTLKATFGFLMPDGCHREHDAHFFHATDVRGGAFHRLAIGQAVEFESTFSAEDGLRAANVRPAPTGHAPRAA